MSRALREEVQVIPVTMMGTRPMTSFPRQACEMDTRFGLSAMFMSVPNTFWLFTCATWPALLCSCPHTPRDQALRTKPLPATAHPMTVVKRK